MTLFTHHPRWRDGDTLKSIHARVLLLTLFRMALSCPAETLQQLLAVNHVPFTSFSQSELMEQVRGSAQEDAKHVRLEYRALRNHTFVGPLHLVRYDKLSGGLIRPHLNLHESDSCSGELYDVSYIDEFTLTSTSISPSAECLFVLDKNVKIS